MEILINQRQLKILIKKFIPNNSLLFRFISKIYYYKVWKPMTKNISKILENYANLKKDVIFLQIGSNNGKNGDPIYRHVINGNWKGVLVEPVKYLYDELIKNYKYCQGRLIFENVAISHENGEESFYRLKKCENPDLPIWYDQLGSFKKDVILKHKRDIPNLEELLIEEKVHTINFHSLVDKHSLHGINLLHIDTEGFDFEIIKMMNFDILKPDILLFEHKHLPILDYQTCINLLKKKKYKLFSHEGNTIAIYRNFLKRNRKILYTSANNYAKEYCRN